MNDGGPAFPRAGYQSTYASQDADAFEGMSLRDYFAGQALAGIKANNELLKMIAQDREMTLPELIAIMAYKDADAMLAERQKEKP